MSTQHRYRRTCGPDDLALMAGLARAEQLDRHHVAGRRVGKAEGRARGWLDVAICMVAGAILGVALFAITRGW